MTLTIKLSDAQVTALQAKAAAEGLSVEQWIQKLAEPVPAIRDAELAALRRKNFVELCDPVRGLAEDIDFSRNPSTGRPLDL